ncbi:hypothetical protein KAF80_22465 [Bacillus sp. WL1]|uniref:hypothetical protein n=1 Tax=Bacillus sp. WL1 TaxID=2822693 RepID=UPI001B343204|nr:hypothetical protein [Bacillus sp. WL1]MBP3971757.1 hypothetical protein [Bacillus sp. WL1]
MFKKFKKDTRDNEATIMMAEDTFDIFLFPTSRENQYHLVTENFHNMGYNHFLLFVDSENHTLHIYDEISNVTSGTSAINRIGKYLIAKMYELLNLKDYKNAKVLIYFPESHKDFGLVSYGYHAEIDAFDFGLDISNVTKYQAFIELAKNHA